MLGVVAQLHDELATRAGPRLVRLPDVDVLAVAELQRAATRRDGLLDRVGRECRQAGDLHRTRITGRRDAQALVSAQGELHRDGAAGLGHVQSPVVDRLEEPGEDPRGPGRCGSRSAPRCSCRYRPVTP